MGMLEILIRRSDLPAEAGVETVSCGPRRSVLMVLMATSRLEAAVEGTAGRGPCPPRRGAPGPRSVPGPPPARWR